MFSPLIQRHGTTQLGEVNPQFDVPYNRMDATWGKQIICARGEECPGAPPPTPLQEETAHTF